MNNELREKLMGQLAQLRQRFGEGVRQFESAQLKESLRSADDVLAQIKVLAQEISSHYEAGLKERLDLSEAASTLERVKGKAELDRNECLQAFVSIEKSVRQITREVQFQYRKPLIASLITAYGRKAAIGALGVLVLFVAIKGFQLYRMRSFGLTGQYYAGLNFEKLVRTRKDPQIRFSWGRKSPGFLIPRDRFSVRWSGFVRIPRPGQYEFITGSDDGVRLWINDKIIIDDWHNVRRYKTNRGTVDLPSGPHKIQLEYFEYAGPAGVELQWRHQDEKAGSLIPPHQLIPDEKYR
jgi:hypothetical protein